MMKRLHLRLLLHKGAGEAEALDEIIEDLAVDHVQDQAIDSVLTHQVGLKVIKELSVSLKNSVLQFHIFLNQVTSLLRPRTSTILIILSNTSTIL